MQHINKDDERVNRVFSIIMIALIMTLFIGAFFGALTTYFFIKL